MIPARSQFESLLFGCWIDRKAGLSHRKEEMGEYRLLQAKAAEDAAPHDGARCLKTPRRCERKGFNAVLLRAWRLAVPRRCEHEDRRCCALASILQKPPFRCRSKTDKAPAASPEHAQRGFSVNHSSLAEIYDSDSIKVRREEFDLRFCAGAQNYRPRRLPKTRFCGSES